MNKGFAWKLAISNIKTNRKFYLPYIFAGIGTIALFYIMSYLAFDGIKDMDHATLAVVMLLGTIVIGLFSAIFLFYVNSFLMKRRTKEIGLYNILGMEKKHISKILLMENFIVSTSTILAGLLCGILFSKLVFMILNSVVTFSSPILFTISGPGVLATIVLFAVIYLVALLYNQMRIRLANPIELLKGGSTGEKEPKSKLVLAIIGAICLGVGYYIAITTESPLKALALFFVAVILVIIGTYCLFVSGSIVILKALRKNKKFYYKPGNFTTVSGMIYRMKQNAVGLANICILSTMVLVMISTTVSLYVGTSDIISQRFDGDVALSVFVEDADDIPIAKIHDELSDMAKAKDMKVKQFKTVTYLSFASGQNEGNYTLNVPNDISSSDVTDFSFITAKEYKKLTGDNVSLKKNEVLAYCDGEQVNRTFTIGSMKFHVKDYVDKFFSFGRKSTMISSGDANCIVVADESVFSDIYQMQADAFGDNASYISNDMAFNLTGSKQEKIDYVNNIDQGLKNVAADCSGYAAECKQAVEQEYYSLIGGFLFLGIFLGTAFTFAAALIIYYKQISEGYSDKERFKIMEKVGMSRSEVKKAIKKQVVMVFLLPLLIAGIHVLAAFKMITRLLLIFSLTNVGLFAICTVITFAVFALIYALVYSVTAREYYKIVAVEA